MLRKVSAYPNDRTATPPIITAAGYKGVGAMQREILACTVASAEIYKTI